MLDILGALIVRTQIPWPIARNSLTHHSVVSELFPPSLKLSIYLGHTYTCISHSHSIGPSKTLSLSLVLSPSHTHTHTISCLASQV